MGGVPVFQNVVAIIMSDLVSLRATLESSFSIEQRGFTISTTISLTIEPGSTAVKKNTRMSNLDK